jgi:hypothetical protein
MERSESDEQFFTQTEGNIPWVEYPFQNRILDSVPNLIFFQAILLRRARDQIGDILGVFLRVTKALVYSRSLVAINAVGVVRRQDGPERLIDSVAVGGDDDAMRSTSHLR